MKIAMGTVTDGKITLDDPSAITDMKRVRLIIESADCDCHWNGGAPYPDFADEIEFAKASRKSAGAATRRELGELAELD
jgi:hypothetical protein